MDRNPLAPASPPVSGGDAGTSDDWTRDSKNSKWGSAAERAQHLVGLVRRFAGQRRQRRREGRVDLSSGLLVQRTLQLAKGGANGADQVPRLLALRVGLGLVEL